MDSWVHCQPAQKTSFPNMVRKDDHRHGSFLFYKKKPNLFYHILFSFSSFVIKMLNGGKFQ